jgi:hypothetical protein
MIINNIVGKWFHSFNEKGEVVWQGNVLSCSDNDCIVQLYSWWDGEPMDRVTVLIEDTNKWCFYDTNQEMINAKLHNVLK